MKTGKSGRGQVRRMLRVTALLLGSALAILRPSSSAAAVQCDVVVGVNQAGALGSLGWSMDYSGAHGIVVGTGANAACDNLVPGALGAFMDDDAKSVLSGGWMADSAVSTPAEVASCVFQAESTPLASDFKLTVTDAADPDVVVPDPLPTMKVLSVNCVPLVTTTTTTTTTTSSTTTTTLPAQGCYQWTVTFRLASSSAPVSSLQMEVDYSKPAGEFLGTGNSAECTKLVSTALFAQFDADGQRHLTLGLIDIGGFSAPRDLVACTFASVSPNGLAPADFKVSFSDSADPYGDPVSVGVTVSVVATTAAVTCSSQCGDGVVQSGEQCDDGNTSNADACTSACLNARCGDGLVHSGVEACDDGNTSNADACVGSCVAATCGDGFTRSGVEECDDANFVETDACRSSCVAARCGDGIVRAGVETCDDGNLTNTDACLNTCVAAKCGDGFVRSGIEVCDDGNSVNTDACLNTCVAAKCGDGYVRSGVEACDDANAVNTDACLDTCVAAKCGDGYVRAGVEACDDGNLANTDACLNSCAAAKCGDGYVRAGFEGCDDGNQSDNDACLKTCAPASCGDGIVRYGVEQCDDANTGEMDGCSSGCLSGPRCADPSGDGRVLVGDALRILQSAVALDVECPDWTCDSNGDGRVMASDAMLALTASVGLPATLKCHAPNSLVLRLSSASTLAGLQVDVDYEEALADLAGDGASVQCTGLVPGASYAFNDQPTRNLTMSMIALNTATGPRNVAKCLMSPSGMVRTQDFFVSIVDAVSATGATVSGVQVKAIPY